ncbi:MAG: oxidoreductase [Burkholderiales bacterium]|nr:oxidoreductase [Burkholderiales bacterium]
MKGILLTKPESGFSAAVTEIDEAQLPEGDVTVRIDFSTLNYKDGLALTNRSPVVRKWPMVPGIDFAGTVETSAHADFKPGDQVILNGWGVGETHWGGLAQKARVKGDWLVPLPSKFSTRQAMALGTAGYTAMLSVMRMEAFGVTKDQGEILVTGATGGVGSVAVAILAEWGYRVVASTGKMAEADYLAQLGAAEVIDRAALSAPGKPLQKERFAGVIDSVGSHTLVNACAQTRYGGVVAACGLAQGMDFPATVAPFILRGVTLAGIDSVMAPKALRVKAWSKLACNIVPAKLDRMTKVLGLSDAVVAAADLMIGKIRGRVVVDVNA